MGDLFAVASKALQYRIPFYNGEHEFYRAGKGAHLAMLAHTASLNLDYAGAIGPYVFWIEGGDGNLVQRMFVGSEAY